MANPYSAYVESRVLTASPVQLVHLAYQGAIEAIVEARRHLAAKRIRERGQAITRAQLIITELQSSLDHRRGSDLSTRLASLYAYMQRRLREAHIKQLEEPMAEVQNLLETIDEAWKEIVAPDTQAEVGVAVAVPSNSPWRVTETHDHSSIGYTL